jgi:type IV secretion system protein VirB6
MGATSFVYFALIYQWLERRIDDFSAGVLQRTMAWAGAIALTLVTVWIIIQGYRMITGQSKEPMMAMIGNMLKIAVIVTAASTMSFLNLPLNQWFTNDLKTGINQLVTGEAVDPAGNIDNNLAYTQLAMAAIAAVEIPGNDNDNSNAKDRAGLLGMLGIAGPPMTAGALLLMYKIALALFIGFGPIFILCLIFEQTKPLFHKWLMYGIGLLFSFAVLNFVVDLVLQMTLNVAKALWVSQFANTLLGQGAEGFTNQSMQQGGVGLLMTVLLISTPPMAAAFFNATIGNFSPYPTVSGGNQPRPAGGGYMPPAGGGYHGGGGYVPPPVSQLPNQSAPTQNWGNRVPSVTQPASKGEN